MALLLGLKAFFKPEGSEGFLLLQKKIQISILNYYILYMAFDLKIFFQRNTHQ